MSQTIQDAPSSGEPDPSAPTAGAAGGAPAEANGERQSDLNFESLAVAGFVFGLFAIVIAVFAVGLAARAVTEKSQAGTGGSSSSSAPATLDVSLTEFKIDPAEGAIAKDGTITVTNDGTTDHDLVVEDHKSELLKSGASGKLDLTGLAPGDYAYYCSVPGHREAGMEGTLTVQ